MEALSGRVGVKCGRWNPTAEQVKVLTELFRAGLRTPSTEQIQRISTHLSAFGKVESKNVFYWFQNHKARERQRLRRRLCARHQQQPSPPSSTVPPAPTAAAAGAVVQVHPAVMQLHHHHHHHHPYAAAAAAQSHHLQQQQQQQQAEWPVVDYCSTASASASATAADMAIPPCCRPLKTLELFPTKSTSGGLKEDCCSSSKSSSCSTSTN